MLTQGRGKWADSMKRIMIPYCGPVDHLIAVTLPSSLAEAFFIVIAMVLNFSYPLISTQFSFHVRCRAENNGRSTDNVRPDHEFRHPRMMILKVERTLNTQKL